MPRNCSTLASCVHQGCSWDESIKDALRLPDLSHLSWFWRSGSRGGSHWDDTARTHGLLAAERESLDGSLVTCCRLSLLTAELAGAADHPDLGKTCRRSGRVGFSTSRNAPGDEPHAAATHAAWLVHRLAVGVRRVLAHPASQLPPSAVRIQLSSTLPPLPPHL